MHGFIRTSGSFAALALLASAAHGIDQTVVELAPPDSIEVPIVLLVDLRSGQTLLEKEATRRFMPASITKVMSAFVAFEMIEAGELNERQQFVFRPESAEKWRSVGSTMFLDAGESVPVWLLLRGITSVSANDASIVLAEGATGSVEAWTERMNAEARRLGMNDSHFNTPNGWMDEGRTFTSARDLERLARAIITRHPEKYARYFGQIGLEHKGIAQPNHDPITGKVRGADGIKTGFTNEAGFGFLGSAERNGTRLVLVVAGADRARARDKLSRELIEWGFAAFDRQLLYLADQVVAEAKVQDGSRRHVDLVPAAPIHVAVLRGSNPDISMRLKYDGPIRAPFDEGDEIAELELTVAGMPTSRIPLVARQTVDEANAFERIWNGVAGWFS
ncbi:D-alanyl-D-alanine carboxypeptidase [Altererythrobacter arenosus]|uniref:serine-type D-Ala-D-Ala carboxypeptidase n=1 Tax=Altererythrobacter arenosus TaxID=3032592 RepID=A0ABY8FT32_9SPHN|nr:D-alanyl-D-alanine carboxypeptidase family protein [Altererythrobacter sp. CAU 1644]WFL77073.1 D-alanyl-D-alanine carboxypeptidase [Altererythrobacter sp. CAU 1644]